MLTPKAIDFDNINAFKTWNFKYIDNPQDAIVDSIAILIGEYDITRKHAAILLLKILMRNKFYKFLFEDKQLYPISRNDNRVSKWAKDIISKGYCEKCGSKQNLEAHHIIKWADYPQGRIDINNGSCLCLECHTQEHKYDQSYNLMKGKLAYVLNT